MFSIILLFNEHWLLNIACPDVNPVEDPVEDIEELR